MPTATPNILRILFNGGDNMLGRAVQLSFPVQAENEAQLRDSCTAEHYLNMCLHPSADEMSLDQIREANKHGQYLWGDYRMLRLNLPPDLRLLNMETALTTSIDNDDIPWEKGINYHFHLDNFEGVMEGYQNVCHYAAGIDAKCIPSPVCITLSNNHIMDFGRKAFTEETLPYLNKYTQKVRGSTQFVGAGSNIQEASRPAHWTLNAQSTNDEKKEVDMYVIAAGSMDSGVPRQWAASQDTPGVFWLPRLDSMHAVNEAVELLKHCMAVHGIMPKAKKLNDSLVILSIHWGPNWAYRYSGDNQKWRQAFAHACIDQCSVDVIYGHSSHHIRGMEAYNGKLIIYGAGDLINDYEGFANTGDEVSIRFTSVHFRIYCILLSSHPVYSSLRSIASTAPYF